MLQQEGNWFSQAGKAFKTELCYKTNFLPGGGKAREAKSLSEPVWSICLLTDSNNGTPGCGKRLNKIGLKKD